MAVPGERVPAKPEQRGAVPAWLRPMRRGLRGARACVVAPCCAPRAVFARSSAASACVCAAAGVAADCAACACACAHLDCATSALSGLLGVFGRGCAGHTQAGSLLRACGAMSGLTRTLARRTQTPTRKPPPPPRVTRTRLFPMAQSESRAQLCSPSRSFPLLLRRRSGGEASGLERREERHEKA
eukprot:2844904-Rhodomonas_salina.1